MMISVALRSVSSIDDAEILLNCHVNHKKNTFKNTHYFNKRFLKVVDVLYTLTTSYHHALATHTTTYTPLTSTTLPTRRLHLRHLHATPSRAPPAT